MKCVKKKFDVVSASMTTSKAKVRESLSTMPLH